MEENITKDKREPKYKSGARNHTKNGLIANLNKLQNEK